MKDDFRIAARLKDGTFAHERRAKLTGVDEIPVVADRNLTVSAIDQNRLRIDQLALSCGRIADMADRHGAGQLAELILVERFSHMTHRP